jgi:hypothetical protein
MNEVEECLRGLEVIKNPLDKIISLFGKKAKLYYEYMQDIKTLDFAMRFIRRVSVETIENAIRAEYSRQKEFGMEPSFNDLAIAIEERIRKGAKIISAEKGDV